ncbi:hypothetical protein HDV00_000615 [Rhizophlyctis rosea]|nr:hypothetical protein HDV00_000615 [Rhizophlyctis rosea]
MTAIVRRLSIHITSHLASHRVPVVACRPCLINSTRFNFVRPTSPPSRPLPQIIWNYPIPRNTSSQSSKNLQPRLDGFRSTQDDDANEDDEASGQSEVRVHIETKSAILNEEGAEVEALTHGGNTAAAVPNGDVDVVKSITEAQTLNADDDRENISKKEEGEEPHQDLINWGIRKTSEWKGEAATSGGGR